MKTSVTLQKYANNVVGRLEDLDVKGGNYIKTSHVPITRRIFNIHPVFHGLFYRSFLYF
jgi:hypothetical protein